MNPTTTGSIPSGARPTGPPPRRKKVDSDPFFSGPKRTAAQPVRNGIQAPKVNGVAAQPTVSVPVLTVPSNTSAQRPLTTSTVGVAPEDKVSGFSDPRTTAGAVPYKDYRLVTTKKDLLDGFRFHILQLVGNRVIDIRDEASFPKPAHLHRRDRLAAPPGIVKDDEIIEPKDGLNPAEREELNRRKEMRQKEREANLAQIAPSQNTAKKQHNFKKKTQQVFRANLTEDDKRRIQMNYEEKLPWHLEDFDNKHCFIGQNQQGSFNQHVALAFEPAAEGTTGKYRLMPVQKLYHFKHKPTFQYMTAEEVDAKYKDKDDRMPEWLRTIRQQRLDDARTDFFNAQNKGLYTGSQVANLAGRQGEEGDMDFNYEEDFADDEEGALFQDKDEDEKLAESRIKEENLRANIFDIKEAKEWDDEEEKQQKAEELRKRSGKKIRRALEKRERNYNHGSDSEDDSMTDSDEERDRLDQDKLKPKKEEDGEKSGGASGTNTPSGRKEKISGTASDRENMVKKAKLLKRPGSPNLSDASGTDTSVRKKHKARHLSSSQPTPMGSRPLSPANVPSSQRPRRPGRGGSGLGSDTEPMQSDREGAAMSDGERRRVKLRVGSPVGTSRSGSPAPAASSISRPGSTGPVEPVQFPTKEDIRKAITEAGGLAIKDLPQRIRHPAERRLEFIALVKQVARLDKERGVLVMKD